MAVTRLSLRLAAHQRRWAVLHAIHDRAGADGVEVGVEEDPGDWLQLVLHGEHPQLDFTAEAILDWFVKFRRR